MLPQNRLSTDDRPSHHYFNTQQRVPVPTMRISSPVIFYCQSGGREQNYPHSHKVTSTQQELCIFPTRCKSHRHTTASSVLECKDNPNLQKYSFLIPVCPSPHSSVRKHQIVEGEVARIQPHCFGSHLTHHCFQTFVRCFEEVELGVISVLIVSHVQAPDGHFSSIVQILKWDN